MDYTEMIRTADAFAERSHAGQKDRQGVAYIEHPRKVASFLEDPKLKVVALLHDVMEDTAADPQQIRDMFGDEVADLLQILTHDKREPYRAYIRRISQNEEAKKVKLADLRHNMDLTRYQYISRQNIDFLAERYVPAYNFLMNGGEY